MSEAQDSVPELAAQPQKGRKGSRLDKSEARERKNDTGRLVRWLNRGGAVTRDTPRWVRADRTGVYFNTHVCERRVRLGELVLVDGSRQTYQLRADLLTSDEV